MKYKKLVGKFDKLIEKHARGRDIKAGKFDELRRLLNEKKTRYETKLAVIEDPEKRHKLKTRIKVVEAQLEKSARLQIGK